MTTKQGDISFGDDELVINYHDAVVYGSDLNLFELRSAWLNDACIHFFFTWLQQRQQQSQDGAAAGATSATHTIFLDPAVVSFVMHQCSDQEDVDDFLSGNNNFDNVQRIFVPINDMLASSQWARLGGGSHWSLLLILIPQQKQENSDTGSYQLWHFDSIRGNNNRAARVVAAKFQEILNHAAARRGACLPSMETQVAVVECTTPQQANGYDCGVHMLAAAECLSQIPTTSAITSEMCEQVLKSHLTPQSCPEMRSRVAREIRRLHRMLQ